jgi:Asp-tRNA(Asn)/Glu-tRNA(Gln) amidotransferase C subunit
MAEIDQIAAVKASLELMSQENEEMLKQFKEVIEKLEAIEQLPPGIKAVQFRQLEQSGAFKFRNVDIRHFSKSSKGALTPPQFVERTNRRLNNTSALIEAFLKHEEFEGGAELRDAINGLTQEIFDQNDQKAVLDFKGKVETLRETPVFTSYLDAKTTFIKGNPELKAEADFLATKETVADGEMLAEAKGEELKDLQEAVDSGEVSPEEAQHKIDEMEAEAEAKPEAEAEAESKPEAQTDPKD